jgi:hypothetical protein
MRRWMFIAALGAALLSTPLWAQRGGGGHGGMGAGHGFSGGSVGSYHGGAPAYHGSVGYGGAYRGSAGYGGAYRGSVGYGGAYRGSTYGYRGREALAAGTVPVGMAAGTAMDGVIRIGPDGAGAAIPGGASAMQVGDIPSGDLAGMVAWGGMTPRITPTIPTLKAIRRTCT